MFVSDLGQVGGFSGSSTNETDHHDITEILILFISIMMCRKTSLSLYHIGPACVRYHCPNHNIPSAKSVHLLNVVGGKTFITVGICTLALPSVRCSRNRDSSLSQTDLQRWAAFEPTGVCSVGDVASEQQLSPVVLPLFLHRVIGCVRSDRRL